jgi:hypothetical protein
MYWTVGQYTDLSWPDEPESKYASEWRIISGPHRSKTIAQDVGVWELRRQRVRPGDSGWMLVQWRVVKEEHLLYYGLAPEAKAWQLRMKLEGEIK